MIDENRREAIREEIADILRPATQEIDEITTREYADMEGLSRDVAYGRLAGAVDAGLMMKRKVLLDGRWQTVFKLAGGEHES